MKTANFNDTVDILVKAYLDDTLAHGQCEKCAVGNIVLAAGFKRYGSTMVMPEDSCGNWKALFHTYQDTKRQSRRNTNDKEWIQLAENMISKTGYTEDELARVEFAFETAEEGNSTDEYRFNGLMDVVDVLADIHGISLEAKTEAKAMFVKS